MDVLDLKKYIKDVPDFPKEGILFKDISPLLASPKARSYAIRQLCNHYHDKNIDAVVGIEARGFLLGILLAQALNVPFVMLRKPGKLPGELVNHSYNLEYGTDSLELQKNAVKPGQRVLIHDDVLATGGTAAAAVEIIKQMGAEVVGVNFLMELDDLHGRDQVHEFPVYSLLNY